MKKRARATKSATPATLPPGLTAAGTVKLAYQGYALQGLAKVLEAGAGVGQKRGERAADIRAWKLACGINFDRVAAAADGLSATIRNNLHNAETPAWQVLGGLLEKAAADVLDAPIPADVVLMLAFHAGDARASLSEGYGKEKAGALREAAKKIVGENTEAAFDRRKALHAATELAGVEVMIELQRVAWDRAPIGLHGGYLRELAWMFAEIPPQIRPLVDAAAFRARPAAEGVDA